jgi:hypothetical protein
MDTKELVQQEMKRAEFMLMWRRHYKLELWPSLTLEKVPEGATIPVESRSKEKLVGPN